MEHCGEQMVKWSGLGSNTIYTCVVCDWTYTSEQKEAR